MTTDGLEVDDICSGFGVTYLGMQGTSRANVRRRCRQQRIIVALILPPLTNYSVEAAEKDFTAGKRVPYNCHA